MFWATRFLPMAEAVIAGLHVTPPLKRGRRPYGRGSRIRLQTCRLGVREALLGGAFIVRLIKKTGDIATSSISLKEQAYYL